MLEGGCQSAIIKLLSTETTQIYTKRKLGIFIQVFLNFVDMYYYSIFR